MSKTAASLHLKPTNDLDQKTLESFAAHLEPETQAYVRRGAWISIYAEIFESSAANELLELGQHLLPYGRIIGISTGATPLFLALQGELRVAAGPGIQDLQGSTDLSLDEPITFGSAAEVPIHVAKSLLSALKAGSNAALQEVAAHLGIARIDLTFAELVSLANEQALGPEFTLIKGPLLGKPGLREFFGGDKDE